MLLPSVGAHAFNPRQRQMNLYEFEANLVYMVIFRPARDTKKEQDPVTNKQYWELPKVLWFQAKAAPRCSLSLVWTEQFY